MKSPTSLAFKVAKLSSSDTKSLSASLLHVSLFVEAHFSINDSAQPREENISSSSWNLMPKKGLHCSAGINTHNNFNFDKSLEHIRVKTKSTSCIFWGAKLKGAGKSVLQSTCNDEHHTDERGGNCFCPQRNRWKH